MAFVCVGDGKRSANSPLAKHLVCDNIVPSEDRLPMPISAGFVLLRFLGDGTASGVLRQDVISDGNTPRQTAKTTTVGPAQDV